MNKRQIILDFTSLLDVIMIILFFFILFSSLEKNEALETEREQLQAECEALKKEAQDKIKESEDLLAEYREALSNLENSGESAAQNIAAMHKFDQSMNLKIHMKMGSNNNTNFWQLNVFSGTDKKNKLGEIKIDISSADKDMDSMVQALSELLNKAGYTEESTILCEFFYNGVEKNTSKAYPIAENLFKRIRFSYRNFKVSETDTSIFTQANTTKEDTTNEKK